MWLAVIFIAALVASAAYLAFPAERKKWKLSLLALMLWGAAILVAVDKGLAYLGGEPLISEETDGMIKDSALLGAAMVAAVFFVWLAALLVANFKPLAPKG
ncbi:MAG: hypothetical protein N3E51_03370 [Candidatus Micrarchaeota archaeon]|nr:hypothetical protein [Candidatus Micrarchaeota archaeon]